MAQAAQCVDRARQGRPGGGVGGACRHRAVDRDTDSQPARRLRRGPRLSSEDGHGHGDVGHRDRDGPERATAQPVLLEPTREGTVPAGLEPDDAAVGRRDAQRAAAVGAQRKRHHARGHGGRPPVEPPALRPGERGLRVPPKADSVKCY